MTYYIFFDLLNRQHKLLTQNIFQHIRKIMNSSAHYLKRSMISESNVSSGHRPTFSTSIPPTNGMLRSSFGVKNQQSSTELTRTPKNSNPMKFQYLGLSNQQHLQPSQHSRISSSVSSQGNSNRWHYDKIVDEAKENGLERRVTEINYKIGMILDRLDKIERQQKMSTTSPKFIKSIVSEQLSKKQRELNVHSTIMKTDLDNLKTEIKLLANKKQMEKNIKEMESGIKFAIIDVRSTLCKQIDDITQKQSKGKKKDYEELARKIEESQKSLEEQIKSVRLRIINWDEGSFRPSSKLFDGASVELKVMTNLLIKVPNQQLAPISHEKEYRVDSEGFLLDSMNHYLLNQQDQLIQLNPQHIKKLKQLSLLYKM